MIQGRSEAIPREFYALEYIVDMALLGVRNYSMKVVLCIKQCWLLDILCMWFGLVGGVRVNC